MAQKTNDAHADDMAVSTSVFNLDVDFKIFPPSPHTVESFTNFMEKMLDLDRTKGSIERFRLSGIDTSRIDSSCVHAWISAALVRGVKELDLGFDPKSENIPMMLPANDLFNSKTLVRLKRGLPFLMTVPDHVSLPSLKTMELENITFEDDGSVKRLISGCPLLEDLSMLNCNKKNITCLEISNPFVKSLTLVFDCDLLAYHLNFYKFSIAMDVPNLVYLKNVDLIAKEYSIVNMPALVKADMNISVGYFARDGMDQQRGLVQLFRGISNVKTLHLKIYPEALPFLCDERFEACDNLVELETCDAWKLWKGKGLFEFLKFTPY